MKLHPLAQATLMMIGAGVAAQQAVAESVLEIGGVVEVELAQATGFDGVTTSDITLATFELGMAAAINPATRVEVVLLHEEDDTPLEVDTATISYQPENAAWGLAAGQMFVPFGSFESHMISDPLTHEIGETRESALLLNLAAGPVDVVVYTFNGANGADKVDNVGLNLAYHYEGAVNIGVSYSYIDDIAETDGLEAIAAADKVAGQGISVNVSSGDWSLQLESIAASKRFPGAAAAGPKPSATNVEFAYQLQLGGKPAILAIGQQSSAELDPPTLGIPESRTMLALSFELADKVALGFELTSDEDYSVADGGTGNSGDSFTAQLAVQF